VTLKPQVLYPFGSDADVETFVLILTLDRSCWSVIHVRSR